MIEDKLTRDERIRLEALGQATARYAMHGHPDDEIIATAQRFEQWIRAGQESPQAAPEPAPEPGSTRARPAPLGDPLRPSYEAPGFA